jgi:sirohydrochlorin cobaltochelatase
VGGEDVKKGGSCRDGVGGNGDEDGVLLVGHGTRDNRGIKEYLELADSLQGTTGRILAPCFLEFAEPTIAQGVEHLVQAGMRRIVVVPLMLFAAGHVRKDIPQAIAAAVARYPGVRVCQTAHLGCAPPLLELSARRFREAVSGGPASGGEATVLVLVARGNRDADAQAEMRRFAALRRELTPVERLETCFLAMAGPTLAEALDRVRAMPQRRVVVQAHLLFPGLMAASIAEAVEILRRDSPEKTWLVAQPFGADRLLAEVVLDLLSASGIGHERRPTQGGSPSRESNEPACSIRFAPPRRDPPCSGPLNRVRS